MSQQAILPCVYENFGQAIEAVHRGTIDQFEDVDGPTDIEEIDDITACDTNVSVSSLDADEYDYRQMASDMEPTEVSLTPSHHKGKARASTPSPPPMTQRRRTSARLASLRSSEKNG